MHSNADGRAAEGNISRAAANPTLLESLACLATGNAVARIHHLRLRAPLHRSVRDTGVDQVTAGKTKITTADLTEKGSDLLFGQTLCGHGLISNPRRDGYTSSPAMLP